MATATEPAVVVPGNHDGVHRGHRALLQEARRRAQEQGLRVVALFFEPHPLEVLAPDRAPTRLTTAERRQELLRAAGADEVARHRFDAEFAKLSPYEFVQRVLVQQHNARSVVVGPDFRFGHKRAGDVEELRALGEQHGFDVATVEPVQHHGRTVSSSLVREDLQRGDVNAAAELLCRVHEVDGEVVEGDRRGRELGYPTANLRCAPVLLPTDGIYAVTVRRLDASGPRLGGVASLGERPTFDGAGRSVEVYLLDFDEDLYSAQLRVGFVERLRAELKFDGIEALKAEMARDVRRGRQALDAADRELLTWL